MTCVHAVVSGSAFKRSQILTISAVLEGLIFDGANFTHLMINLTFMLEAPFLDICVYSFNKYFLSTCARHRIVGEKNSSFPGAHMKSVIKKKQG